MNKLKWKTKHLDDKSGSWIEADVKPLGWTYVVDNITDEHKGKYNEVFGCFLFVSKNTDETRFTKKTFKSVEKAQEECEKHLKSVYHNLCKIFN